ncbi:MAG: hypothetical protein ABIS50_03810 [Luteolibacter sp.]|uniref:hypothetical protein n=1 Tax=Luteolibacter sp. TaxID=1962973 RepID=UPI0032640514
MPTAQAPKSESEHLQKPDRPAAEFRDANIRVAVWEKIDENGISRHSVSLSRSYSTNGQWKTTHYLGKLDLQRAKKLLDRADDWIFVKSASKSVSEETGLIH